MTTLSNRNGVEWSGMVCSLSVLELIDPAAATFDAIDHKILILVVVLHGVHIGPQFGSGSDLWKTDTEESSCCVNLHFVRLSSD